MTKNSEKIRKWRAQTKQRIIEAMGGKCQICGYNRCATNLALHHKDPTQKDFGLGSVRANPKSWPKIVNELKKCVLLCHICHNELHEGIVELALNHVCFNEKYEQYDKKPLISKTNNCPICGNQKSKYQLTCSNVCAGKKRGKINWDKINLLNLIKEKTITEIAEELNCSETSVRKRLKKCSLSKTTQQLS